MSSPDQPRNRALDYWPYIEKAAAERMPTAELWDVLRQAAAEQGLDTPGVTLQEVNELRSMATTIQANAGRLERLDPSAAIDGRMFSEAPWSRPLEYRQALPMYQVRFQHTIAGPEGETTEWRTSTFRGGLPRTLQELLDAVEEDAENLADKYGGAHVGVGSLQVLTV